MAKAVEGLRPFDGTTTNLTMGEAGLFPQKDPRTGFPVPDYYTLVADYFLSNKKVRAATALYATADDRGATLRDVYFSDSFDATTILHETLHFFTGMGGDELAKKLGVAGHDDISDALKAGGCE